MPRLFVTAPSLFALLALALACSQVQAQATGKVKVTVKGTEGGEVPAVVRLEGVPDSNPRLKGVTRDGEMGQDKLQFAPQFVVVPAGSTISFPNHDKVFHNVFSMSGTKRFDLGLYKAGNSKSVTFKRPGVVDVYCNIHPQMVAKILVVDTIHYGETDKKGVVKLEGVPPGTYPVVVWSASGAEARGEVAVVAGKTATLTLSLGEKDKAKKHLRKDGTPYGRYK